MRKYVFFGSNLADGGWAPSGRPDLNKDLTSAGFDIDRISTRRRATEAVGKGPSGRSRKRFKGNADPVASF